MSPNWKPERRKLVKARAHQAEVKVISAVRAKTSRRDGPCRLAWVCAMPRRWDGVEAFGACRGPSEWAHLGAHRRCKTRGQPPEARHTTAGSLMMCKRHHNAYDDHRIEITPMTPRGADGPLRWTCGTFIYEEAPA